jgi:hypothetical protein
VTAPPCIRHGERGIADARVVAVLEASSRAAVRELAARIASMTDFDGQLWTTWRSSEDRDACAAFVDNAWQQNGGARGTLHLVRSDADYDYQEDCMNEAASPSGKAGDA